MEQYKLLKEFLKDGDVPYLLPSKPIPDEVIQEILEKIPTAACVDDLTEYARAYWNLICKSNLRGVPSRFDDYKQAYAWLKKNSHYPEYGMSVVKIGRKEYIVCHEGVNDA